jgi:DNA polymerase (family X)
VPAHNADIARLFKEMADLLELSDASPFRVGAYRNAARVVGELRLDITASIAKGETLPKLSAIEEDLSGEIATTGLLTALNRLRQTLPSATAESPRIPGIGPTDGWFLWRDRVRFR